MIRGVATLPRRLLAHPVRHRLLLEYGSGPQSPARVAERLGERLNLVAYHTRVLARHGYVELVRTERARGALTHYYRSIAGPVIEDAEWSALPEALRRDLIAAMLDRIGEEARRAAGAGGFDHRAAHLTRLRLELDDEGVLEVSRRLRAALEEVARVAERAAAADEATRYRLVILGYDMPALSR
jgi:hypothetical protein